MTDTTFDAEAYAEQVAHALALPLDPRHKPGVVMNLRLAVRMAAMMEAVALTPADEAAPVFVAARGEP